MHRMLLMLIVSCNALSELMVRLSEPMVRFVDNIMTLWVRSYTSVVRKARQ